MDLTGLLAAHPVIDGHNDLLWTAREEAAYDFSRLDVGAGGTPTHTDLPRMRAGGMGAQFWSVYVPTRLTGDAAVSATLEQVDAARMLTSRYADQLAWATTADEVEDAWATDRMASLAGAEGGHSIGCSLGTLRQLHELGVRYLTLTHNANTPWADSATDAPVAGGLTAFGREVVREMNRIGMMVDLSHVSADTMRAALETTEAPVIFSHSSARAVTDSPRNAPDDVLEATARGGGVCMVTFVPKFVNAACAEAHRELVAAAAADGIPEADGVRFAAFERAWVPDHPQPTATLADVVAHVEHVREVAGIDHVGLGGDYDGVETLPAGLEDVSTYPALLAALAERGWSSGDLARLTCRNTLRVMREVESVARDLQAVRGPSLARIEDLDGPPAAHP
ncbi:dipeptidase [Nocardioides ganghwensis]|uniref:Membrane dipeptidase n=1 Tax=Nocardioides ganghwensis TaxID=252230 RepID=A0A4Q2SAD3_9ACTN|nr:dipeptidase [Nocardioides ganghwensis]MBD3947319.1 dipeptidase [Nocardioides ganghwensis]RYC00265.1 membrane dipeptidase [Nocardioides ganghwensis]